VRTLVISDIHGNLAALEAVAREPHDAVVCLGDIVGYGPHPGACMRWIGEHANLVVQGNHDCAAGDRVSARCPPAFQRLADAVAPLVESQLTDSDRAFLSALPHWAFLDFPGGRSICVHATPGDPLYRAVGPDADAWLVEVAGVDAEVALVGHTHLQFDLSIAPVGQTPGRCRRVVNPGSVGQPLDGDPRAAYGVFEDGEIELKRASYPVERTVGALRRALPGSPAVDIFATMLRTGRVSAAQSDAPT
jgi:predicted phosphodiesterase